LKHLYLAAIILIKFILQFVLVHPDYDLQRDEYLHLDQGLHLAWGYLSVPPMTSWISFFIQLVGPSELWVRFVPALFGAMTLVLTWKMIEKLNGGLFACVLGTTAMLISPLLRINILYQPNSLDVFFWTLAFYVLLRWIQTNEPRWIYMMALTFALGIYSKYNILFLMAGILPALLITTQRKIFANKHLYIAMGLGVVLVFPNLLWQLKNHLPMLHHFRELAETQLVNMSRMDFMKDQFIYFINSFFIIIAAFTGFCFYPPFKPYRVIALTYLFTISLFLFFKAKSYYPFGLYPVLMAFGAVYIIQLTQSGWKKILRPVSLSLVVVLAIPLFMIGFPNKRPEQIKQHPELYQFFGLLRWEDGKDHAIPQDFSDMLGWSELAEKVDAVYDTIQNQEQTLVLCDNYGEAGAINYYSRHKNINAVSFNADYINWFPLDKPILNVIAIKDSDSAEEEINGTAPLFHSAYRAGAIENPDAREFGTTILVFEGAKENINALVSKEIAEEKSR